MGTHDQHTQGRVVLEPTLLMRADVDLGRRIIESLDEAKEPVPAAFWFRSEDTNEWRLMLAMRIVRKKGPLAAYKAVQSALARLGLRDGKTLFRIAVVEPKHPAVVALSAEFQIERGKWGDIRIDRCYVNRVYIHGAYIYRTAPIRRRRTK